MHGNTACGIETFIYFTFCNVLLVACMEIPLAVLKLWQFQCDFLALQVACMEIPLAVLKLFTMKQLQ